MQDLTTEAFVLRRPHRQIAAVIFASPHSGANYSKEFLQSSVLDPMALRSSEDAFVDRLFDQAPLLGAPLLSACAPRAFLDLNRGADELDPAVIEHIQRPAHNPRISSGLGVIPRVVAKGQAIYRGKLARAEVDERLQRFWQPYHAMQAGLMAETRAAFGEAVLIDCHSMPHEAIEMQSRGSQPRPEVVLGDRFGAAAGAEISDLIESAFSGAGLRVARNTPFAGAYIAQAYGRPSRGMHVVQVEIDRALYMDEAQIQPRSDFDDFHRLIAEVQGRILTMMQRRQALAAE